MTETKAARVEQNTKQKAKPSTLYQVLAGSARRHAAPLGLINYLVIL